MVDSAKCTSACADSAPAMTNKNAKCEQSMSKRRMEWPSRRIWAAEYTLFVGLGRQVFGVGKRSGRSDWLFRLSLAESGHKSVLDESHPAELFVCKLLCKTHTPLVAQKCHTLHRNAPTIHSDLTQVLEKSHVDELVRNGCVTKKRNG